MSYDLLVEQKVSSRTEPIQERFAASELPHEIDIADLLGIFIDQLRSIPLLSADEEAALAWEVRCGQQAQGILDALKDQSPELAHDLIVALDNASDARERLAEANVRLVISIAKSFLWSGLPLADLVQEGNAGLMLAIDRFDPALGNRFSTYARWWIRQSIRRAVTKTAHTIRLPENREMQRQRCHAARNSLQLESGQEPSLAEISDYVGLPLATVEWLLAYEHISISLNDLVGEDSELGDLIADTTTPEPEEAAANILLKEAVGRALDLLPSREADILRLRFGLDDGIKRTIEQVASDYKVSRVRIRQLEAAALKRLCQSPYAEQLSGFLQN